MRYKRKKRLVGNRPKILNFLSFTHNDIEMGYNVPESFKNIYASLPLPCEEHPNTCKKPYVELYQYRENKFMCLKICKKHGNIVSAPVKIYSSGHVKVGRLEARVKSMIRNTLGSIHDLLAEQPDTP